MILFLFTNALGAEALFHKLTNTPRAETSCPWLAHVRSVVAGLRVRGAVVRPQMRGAHYTHDLTSS